MKMNTQFLLLSMLLISTFPFLFSCENNDIHGMWAEGDPALPNGDPGPIAQNVCVAANWPGVELAMQSGPFSEQFISTNNVSTGSLHWDSFEDNQPNSVSNKRWCTGTLISNDLFITAAHCFQREGNWAYPVGVVEPDEFCSRMHVDFNYQIARGTGAIRTQADGHGGEHSYHCEDVLEIGIDGLDYALIRLEGTPGAQYEPADLSDALPSNNIDVLMFQHPRGLPKVLDVGNLTNRVDNGPLLERETGHYVNLETDGGSAGSGLINTLGELIAVHSHGGCEPEGGFGSATLIHAIKMKSPIIGSQFDCRGTCQGHIPFQIKTSFARDSDGHSMCFDVVDGNLRAGQPIQQLDCNGNSAQQFVWAPSIGQIHLAAIPNLCLEAQGGAIQLARCRPQSNQRFEYDLQNRNVRLRDNLNSCLEVENSRNNGFERIVVSRCNNSDAQVFEVPIVTDIIAHSLNQDIRPSIRNPSDQLMCITAENDPIGNNATNIELRTCTGRSGQQFVYESSGGFLRLRNEPNLCMDISGGVIGDGTNIQMFPCNESYSQRFEFDQNTGWIRLRENRRFCLDIDNGSGQDGTNIKLLECRANNNAQVFKLDF